MICEPFANGNSLIHRIDPRLRVLFATLFSFVTALSRQFPVLFAAITVSLVIFFLAGLNSWAVVKRLAVISGFNILIWMILPVTFGKEPFFYIGSISVSMPGVILSAQITLKSYAILLAFISLVSTISFSTLGHVLSRLYIPERIVYLLLMAYRYIFVIEQEYSRLLKAAKLRGFCPGTNLHTYRTYAYLVGMLFVRAIMRSDRVHQAMLCRGFCGKFYSINRFSSSRADWFLSLFMTVVIFVMVFLEWT